MGPTHIAADAVMELFLGHLIQTALALAVAIDSLNIAGRVAIRHDSRGILAEFDVSLTLN